MNDILNYLLESFLIFSVFLLFYYMILEREKCYGFNRYYLLLTPLLALILPLLHIQVQPTSPVASFIFPDNLIMLPELTITAETVVEDSSFMPVWNIILVSIYFTGFVFFLLKFLIQVGKIGLFFLKYRNQFTKLNGYYLVYTNGEIPTFSFFNYIFWDNSRQLSKDEEQQIMEHELKHVHDNHSMDVIYFNILTVVFWFNPFLHLLLIKVGEVHEYIADDTVIRRVDRTDYVSLVARMALSRIHLPVSSFFEKSTTLKRIKKMKSHRQNTSIFKLAAIIPVIGIIILVFSCQDDATNNVADKPDMTLAKQSTSNIDPAARIADLPDIPEEQILDHKLDVDPAPVDGMKEFYYSIQSEMKYPEEAKKNGIEGKVFVEFVIDTEGRIRNVKTLKGIAHGCDEEAVRVLNTIDVKWTPGIQDSKKVNCKMVIPITFKLS